MNQITVVGNVGRDPQELKYTSSGLAVLNFSLADTTGKKGENQHTNWYDVVVFGEDAEAVVDNIKKGDRLIVVGKVKVSEYQKKDGTKGKRVEVIADGIAKSVYRGKRQATEETLAQVREAFDLGDEDEF
jgi:single-strand DNA-binding protein